MTRTITKATAEAATKTLEEIDRVRAAVANQKVPPGEIWGDG
jgi:hypothetical protein